MGKRVENPVESDSRYFKDLVGEHEYCQSLAVPFFFSNVGDNLSTVRQLIVTLLRASNLPVADTFVQGSASDPFVTFQLGDEYLRSSCESGVLEPVWQPAETFEFEVGHQSQATDRQLVVHVVDNDRFKQDDLLGELYLPLSTFERRPNEVVVDTYELQVPEGLRQAVKHPDKKTTVQLDICFAEETDGQKTLCVWENEDYVDGKWTPSHSNERRHWSTFDLQVSSDNFDHVAPEVPEGLEGVGWAYSTKKGDATGGSTPAHTRVPGRLRPLRPATRAVVCGRTTAAPQ